MNAIEHIKELSKNKKPWLIVGKGPSFNPDFRDWSSYNVLAINNSLEVINNNFFHGVIFNDWGIAKKNDFKNVGFVYCSIHKPQKEYVTIFDYVKPVKNLDPNIIYPFNYLHAERQSDECGTMIHAYNSTYESAIWLLAYGGVRDVFTMGIDFGFDYHEKYGLPKRKIGFTAMKYYAQVAIDFFKMRINAIKK